MKKSLIYIIISLILSACAIYLKITQPYLTMEQMFFCLNYGLGNSDFTPLYDGLFYCIPSIIIVFFIGYFILKQKKVNDFLNKTIRINKYKLLYSRLFALIAFLMLLSSLNFYSYIFNNLKSSSFIEKNYVDINDVSIDFKKKKNLIFITLESFESTLIDKNNGGSWDYNLLPEMTKLLKGNDTYTFYDEYNKVGMNMVSGATFTTASIFTNNSAIPLKNKIVKEYTKDNFMNKVVTLGDVLYDNGYNNELISSATTSFGGVNYFFKNHGDYDIIDIDSLEDYNLNIKKQDKNGWGFNDNYLFETAKKRLKILSKSDKPFNLTLIGIDTHFPNGYKEFYTVKDYDTQYENVYRTESILIYNFVNWVKKQDFYKNTTIVIIGDHLSMENKLFKNVNLNDRKVFSCYINPYKKPINKSNRKYTALDTFPSILSSIGANIEGDKIGLGTNLFSEEQTLNEIYSLDEINKNIEKKSKFYDNIIK